jgi:uncharacterized protein (TIGR02118 family)
MSKLIALYQTPNDPAEFDSRYFGSHMPLIKRLPGLEKTEITRFTRTLMGSGFYLMAEMYFADRETLKAALKSPEMEAAGANLNSFAEGLYVLMLGEEEA